MNNENILKKAIEKAIKNGWEEGKEIILDDILRMPDYYTSWDVIATIIFSHSFAKAFWGEETIEHQVVRGYNVDVPIWELELQQMVLEKEPLRYLEKFL